MFKLHKKKKIYVTIEENKIGWEMKIHRYSI